MQGGYRRRPGGGNRGPQARADASPTQKPTAYSRPVRDNGAASPSWREVSLRPPQPKPLSREGFLVRTEWALILITIAGFALLTYHAFGSAAIAALDTIVAGL
jgi:hypothetical protein